MKTSLLVIKSGGAKGNTFEYVLDDLAALWKEGKKWIYIHGGSGRTDAIATQLGYPPQYVTTQAGFTSRRTDRNMLEIFTMVYAGAVNKLLVEGLQKRGVNAIGFSGADGRLLEGTRKKFLKIIDHDKLVMLHDDYTGKVTKVNTSLLLSLVDQGYAPVVCPPAISEEGDLINVDGDRAAAAIANAIEAEQLILLTGQPGLLKQLEDPSSIIASVALSELDAVMERYAMGRMRIKLVAVKEALQGSVQRVCISKSNCEHPVTEALQGKGTCFTR